MANCREDCEELIRLSPDFYQDDGFFTPPEINDNRLINATTNEKFSALFEWFHARYCDPAENTIYITREGGYQWNHGGPYEPFDVLENRFSEVVEFEIIEQVADYIIESTGIDEWASRGWDEHEDNYYYELEIQQPNEIFINLKSNIDKLLKIETLKGDQEALQISRNLLFTSLITALEVYLYETVSYWISKNDKCFMNFVTKYDNVKDRKITYGDIFKILANLRKEVKIMLQQNTVWHNEKNVKNIFKSVFNFDINLSIFSDDILKRNHIIHRISKDFNGAQVIVSKSNILALACKINLFAEEIEKKLKTLHSLEK